MPRVKDIDDEAMRGPDEPRGKLRIKDPGRTGCLVRWVIALTVLVVIVLVTGAVVVKTDGGRDFLTRWLEGKLSMKLEVAETRIGLPYVLVFEGVQSTDYKEKESGLSIEELRIGVGFRPCYRISVRRAELNLQETGKGDWEPLTFIPLANLPRRNVADISLVTREYRDTMILHIAESSIHWLPLGADAAKVGRFSFDMMPADVAGDRMYYHFLSADNVVGVDGATVHDVEREWLASDDSLYIEISRTGSAMPASAAGFWEPDPAAKAQTAKPARKKNP